MQHPFGIDFGGTGIKGAPVDLEAGDFAHDRVRIDTPKPANPQAVAQVFQQIVDKFPAPPAPVGVTVPGIVRRGVVLSAANIDKSWIGEDADAIFTEALGREVHVVNDADAAGLAEGEYGAAKGRQGLVMVITLGTGIGSAMIFDGAAGAQLRDGPPRDRRRRSPRSRAATSAREREGLSWERLVRAPHRPTSATSSGSSPPTCSWSAAGSASRGTSSATSSRSRPRWCPRPCENRAGIVGAALVAHRKAGTED